MIHRAAGGLLLGAACAGALPHGTSHRASASLPIRGAGAGIAMASGGMNSGMVYLDEGTHRRGQQAMAGQRLSLRGGGDPGAELKVDWTQVGGSLFGGLALFLYGMERMGVGLKNAFGDQLRSVLLALSYNRVVGFMTGLVACGITNSLSLISVLLVEFVSSDLIPFDNCMGILLGACVGSTLICFLVVLKVTRMGLGMIALGYLLNATSKSFQTAQMGVAMFGCGIIFMSMDLMSSAFGFIRSHSGFLSLLTKMDNPLLGICVSTAVTGLIQSSGATMSILLSLAGQGMLTIPSSCGLMLGANVGTCVTGMLASIGQPVNGVRLAVSLILFRAAGVAILFPFLSHFIKLVCRLSNIDYRGPKTKSSAADVTLFLAWSHTLFNVILSLSSLPFTKLYADFIKRLIPSPEDDSAASKGNGGGNKGAAGVKRASSSPAMGLSLCHNCNKVPKR